jgi:ATP-dependent DNA helicase RecG
MKENQNIEFKTSWRDDYLKWICGYANAEGGVLYIGKDDNGNVVGLSNVKKLLEDIPNKVRDILGIMVDVNLKSEKKKEYLEIVVAPYPYPVSYCGEYHYRSGSTKQELKGAALDRFLLSKQGRHWDGVPVPNLKLADFDKKTISIFREKALLSKRLPAEILNDSDSSLMDKLHLKEKTYFKRASILLFHPDPEKYVTGSFIKVGFFKSDADLLFHDEIHGNLFTQVDKTMDILLTKYLHARISYKGVQRIESYPVPEKALRESLLNAVAHKDYGSSIPIQISVYDNKVMLWNPGTLPEGWTVDTLIKKHSSQPFNPDIADVFFRAGMIEAWGRGIEKISEACLESGTARFEIEYEPNGLWMIFHFSDSEVDTKTTVETTVKTT